MRMTIGGHKEADACRLKEYLRKVKKRRCAMAFKVRSFSMEIKPMKTKTELRELDAASDFHSQKILNSLAVPDLYTSARTER